MPVQPATPAKPRQFACSRSVFSVVGVGLLLALLVTSSGCGGQQPAVEDTPIAAVPATPPAPPPTRRPEPTEVKPDFPTEDETEKFGEEQLTVEEINRQRPLETIHFGYDQHDLSEESRFTLRRNAEWLRRHQSWGVIIEGHCDDRGTIEYNLALGQRRASAVREYLVSLGIPSNRMRVVTFGEERPSCMGSNEESWRCNRRAEFRVE